MKFKQANTHTIQFMGQGIRFKSEQGQTTKSSRAGQQNNFFIFYFPALSGDESQILEIDDVSIHPTYDPPNAYQDIAVIKLKPNKSKL